MGADELSLKECPSCGSGKVRTVETRTEHTVIEYKDPVEGYVSRLYWHIYAECENCKMRGPVQLSHVDAAYKWNRLPRERGRDSY